MLEGPWTQQQPCGTAAWQVLHARQQGRTHNSATLPTSWMLLSSTPNSEVRSAALLQLSHTLSSSSCTMCGSSTGLGLPFSMHLHCAASVARTWLGGMRQGGASSSLHHGCMEQPAGPGPCKSLPQACTRPSAARRPLQGRAGPRALGAGYSCAICPAPARWQPAQLLCPDPTW